MQKSAQKRSLLNRLREYTNIGGIATEKFFDPEFKKIMDQLRDEVDDPVRAIITGQQIGNASPSDEISLKDLVKSARSNANRREYMSAVADLGKFHKKMDEVVKKLQDFKNNVDKVHHQFLFKDLDSDTEKYLREDLKTRFAKYDTEIVKEAGIGDFWKNISSERGRALASWEKRYPKQVAKLKIETNRLIDKSESLLSSVISLLKKMATARATRKVDDYILTSEKIIKSYIDYDKSFKDYYTSQVKGFIEKQELLYPTTKPIEDVEIISAIKSEEPIILESKKEKEAKDKLELEKIKDKLELEEIKDKLDPKQKALREKIKSQLSQPSPSSKIVEPERLLREQPLSSLPSRIKPEEPIIVSPMVTPEPLEKSKEMPVDIKLPKTELPLLSPELESMLKPSSEQKPPTPAGGVSYRKGPLGQNLPLKPPPQGPLKESYIKFINSLESLADESPLILSKYILKYAKLIKKTDPITSNKLTNIAKDIER